MSLHIVSQNGFNLLWINNKLIQEQKQFNFQELSSLMSKITHIPIPDWVALSI